MQKISVGSVCSGIEAASIAWKELDFEFMWFSEISSFPSKVLNNKFPNVPNVGDMNLIPKLLNRNEILHPDIICGGTPCQAFSLAGWKLGLNDSRGNLTLKFVDITDANDEARRANGKDDTIIVWENVEGVLRDKTNAFGCLIASLAGFETEIENKKWPNAGAIHGPKRNIAWRVIDAKYFGVPQQRRRLYLIAGGKDFFPENILFDGCPRNVVNYKLHPLKIKKDNHFLEVFRSYTDCLYSAYGTKWNGNAAAYNGSLFISQNNRLRRMTPLECERLMGFPDNYTAIKGANATNRYQAIGNSWSVPVIKWIGGRIKNYLRNNKNKSNLSNKTYQFLKTIDNKNVQYFQIPCNMSNFEQTNLLEDFELNGSEIPEFPLEGNLLEIIDTYAEEKYYITPVGCQGILRRKNERKLQINSDLEKILQDIASQWTYNEIEAISRKQKRGRLSQLIQTL